MGPLVRFRRFGFIAALSLLTACTHNVFSGEPYSVFNPSSAGATASVSSKSMLLNSDQLTAIGDDFNRYVQTPTPTKSARNNAISEMMYLIDQAYYDYETNLTHDEQAVGAFGSLATLASTTVSSLIPQGAASRVLSGVATGINGGASIYDQKILLSQTTQALQKQMRADRDTQAATIFGRMNCQYDDYPVGRALVDLEAYARDGTLSSALIALSDATSKNATLAAATKDAASSTANKGGGTGALLARQFMAAAADLTANSTCPLTR
jgi:hypothetical protein